MLQEIAFLLHRPMWMNSLKIKENIKLVGTNEVIIGGFESSQHLISNETAGIRG